MTMSQVARLSGVSRATVSSILNRRADCFASPRTRERVLRTIEAVGYRPNLAARAVTGARSGTLGLIITGPGIEVSTRLRITMITTTNTSRRTTRLDCIVRTYR